MGAYNELIIQDERGAEIAVQFKFGTRFQFRYRVGDEIEFLGRTPTSITEVRGIASDPANERWRYFSIKFNGGKIESYRELTEAEYEQVADI